MNVTTTLLNQILLMFLLIAVGYFLYKKGFLTQQGSKELGYLLIWIIIPSAILHSFNIPFTYQKGIELLISFSLALFAMVISIGVSYLAFGIRRPIDNMASSFCSAAFMGIPLVSATLGSDAVFYIGSLVVLVNILQWTYGMFVMTGQKDHIKLRTILFNPPFIAFMLGLILFISPIKLPSIATSVLVSVKSINTPVAMFILGCYLAQTEIRSMIRIKSLYIVSFFRLLLIPLLTILFFKLIPFGNDTMKLALLITASAPVASTVAVYAQRAKRDVGYAVQTICFSTLVSLATLPLIVTIATYLW